MAGEPAGVRTWAGVLRSLHRRRLGIALAAWLATAVAGAGDTSAGFGVTGWSPPPVSQPATAAGASSVATIIVAGDIASCSWDGDAATARLVRRIPGTVMTAGDNAYQSGSLTEFRECYGPTWGRFRNRTRPVLGNHDVATRGAAGYFRYFGKRAGRPGRGWYGFNAGSWRIYALNTNCRMIGGCKEGSAELRWLRADLEAHPRRCVLAVWHHPRYSSGMHGNVNASRALLSALYRAGAEIVVNGHDHLYERFAAARPNGEADPVHGIRQFIVGTGGAPLYRATRPFAPNSRRRNSATHGVLRLTLHVNRYEWEFVPVRGGGFRDRGSGACHGAPESRTHNARDRWPSRSHPYCAAMCRASSARDRRPSLE
jgi:hypothetical protein